MAIKLYAGLPGKGKTAESTYLAVIQYNKDNTLKNYVKESLHAAKVQTDEYIKIYSDAKRSFRFKLYIRNYISNFVHYFNDLRINPINNIFCNYPVLLEKKRGIMANIFKPSDLCMKYQFPKGSTIFWDETQRDAESRSFKTFNKKMGTFFQHHRHADIRDIILVSQHPRRIDNMLRDLVEIFRKYKIFVKIPFTTIIFAYYTNYYEFEDFGKYNHLKPEFRTYDYDNHFQFLSTKNSFDRYVSKYFAVIFEQLPMIQKVQFKSMTLSADELDAIGVDV